jgi:hypothetical protein
VKPGTIRGLGKFAMIFNAEQDLHTGEVVGSIPTAPTTASVCLLSTSFPEA